MNRTLVYQSLFPPHLATLYADADQAVTKAGLWDWLVELSSRRDRGYPVTDDPRLDIIMSHMKLLDQHNDTSLMVMLRAMEFIAKHGFENWVADVELRRK